MWQELLAGADMAVLQVLTGDSWGDIARGLFESSGNPGAVAAYFASYHIIIVMVLARFRRGCRYMPFSNSHYLHAATVPFM